MAVAPVPSADPALRGRCVSRWAFIAAAVMSVLAGVIWTSPAGAQSLDERLARVQRDQQQAQAQLDQAKGSLAASRSELAAIQSRLASARDQLNLIRGQVALARDGASEAAERQEAAAAVAARSQALLDDATTQLETEQARLGARLVAIHMYGPAAQGELAFAMTLGAEDPVELSRNLFKLEALTAHQDAVVTRVGALQRQQNGIALEAVRAERIAESEAIDAAGALELVAALEDQAETLTDLIAAQEAAQAQTVARLSSTVAGQQELLQDIEQERRAIEAEAAAARFNSTGLVCPIEGVRFINDWGFPRSGGRTHKGNDLFAPEGTPMVAIADGVIRNIDPVDNHRGSGTGDLGGISISYWVSDTEYWYWAHMQQLTPGLREGQSISQGQVLGTVGRTGNARTTPPHAHVQRSTGGRTVNPYNLLKAACG